MIDFPNWSARNCAAAHVKIGGERIVRDAMAEFESTQVRKAEHYSGVDVAYVTLRVSQFLPGSQPVCLICV